MVQKMGAKEQQQIFDEWLKDYKGLFFKVVRSYAFTPHDEEDLLQEIATQVWNSIPKYRGDSKVSTWIYRVALYAAIAWSKRERKHRDELKAIEDLDNVLSVADHPKDHRLDWLYDQISQLDEVERSLTLMMLDGFSYKEISSTLGLSESNVGVKLNRIKKRLIEKSKEGIKYAV